MKPETEQRLVVLLRRLATEASKIEDYLRQVQDEDGRRHTSIRHLFNRNQAQLEEFAKRLRHAGKKAIVELSPGDSHRIQASLSRRETGSGL